MAENATPAGRERPPEEGIQSGPKSVHTGRPPDLREDITSHPELAEIRSQQAQRERAGTAGSQPRSEADKETPWLGWASVTLGAVAICAIGFGLLHLFTGARSVSGAVKSFVPICLGLGMTLPGMAFGLASLAHKGRSNSAGVVGCWTNGLILGVCLLLFAGVVIGWRQPGPPSRLPVSPSNESDLFRR
jgi:hypothetical protein